jgi:hypothetical protein
MPAPVASKAARHSRVAASTLANSRAFTAATASSSPSRPSTRASSGPNGAARLTAASTPITPSPVTSGTAAIRSTGPTSCSG